MVIDDDFTHYIAFNPVPHCNAFYAYTALHEYWIALFGLSEILVTDIGTNFIKKFHKRNLYISHFYNKKDKPRTSHAPLTNGLLMA